MKQHFYSDIAFTRPINQVLSNKHSALFLLPLPEYWFVNAETQSSAALGDAKTDRLEFRRRCSQVQYDLWNTVCTNHCIGNVFSHLKVNLQNKQHVIATYFYLKDRKQIFIGSRVSH